MSVLVAGSIAIDNIRTADGVHRDDLLGGSATYAALAAAISSEVHLVAIVGDDFPGEHLEQFESKGVSTKGLDRVAGGLFGFARGGVVLIFFVYLLNLAMDRDQIPEFVTQARTYPLIAAGANYLGERAPELAERTAQTSNLDEEDRAE